MASGGMIYVPCPMMIGLGNQVILKESYLNNVRGCSVGIADERDMI
jgi:hypothetical protein